MTEMQADLEQDIKTYRDAASLYDEEHEKKLRMQRKKRREQEVRGVSHLVVVGVVAVALARSLAHSLSPLIPSQALEELRHLRTMQHRVLKEALPPALVDSGVTVGNTATANMTPQILAHLSPLMVQFLAWQRLMEINARIAGVAPAVTDLELDTSQAAATSVRPSW